MLLNQNELSTNSLLTGSQVFIGKNATKKNTDAVIQIYNSIKSSYGPYGLDKMCVDSSGSVSITNDGATILKNMLVEDPAARLMVNLALEQDKEVGDGTTSVVILASNLIKKGQELISEGVHPSVIIAGYRLAFNESMKFIKEKISRKINISDKIISDIIDTCISSKIIYEKKELFIEITKKCLLEPNSNYNILKSIGGSMEDSEFFNGFILNCSLSSLLMKKSLKEPKILCIDFSLLKEKLPLTVNINITDPNKLEEIREEEIKMTIKKCQSVIDTGANLVLCTGGIDEICIKMFIENNIIAIRRVDREDIAKIAKASGTTVLKTIYDNNNVILGKCDEFNIKTVGEYELCYFSGFSINFPTVLIKGPNSQIVDEIERALNDSIQILKRTLESKRVVPGGGAVECALSFLLEDFSAKVNAKEHVAIYKFSEALLEIPKILATNAGLDSSKLVSKMIGTQFEQYEKGIFDKFYGLDVVKGGVYENFENGILEPSVYKLKALKAATEAAISILRINEIVIFP